ncbi:hypothetical protein BLIN9172_01267 [Brevibacterium linens ATCC 9172]|uniref:Uncharacterized protein n=1 Tax=Brevibacterium linens ATCC 9172 TaxID=1255617 RepID=A0A2H1IMT4_BRELN|nr:hypothetical protein BLIN9172_01267 [Brevibacterium linens ATCC 9172]
MREPEDTVNLWVNHMDVNLCINGGPTGANLGYSRHIDTAANFETNRFTP